MDQLPPLTRSSETFPSVPPGSLLRAPLTCRTFGQFS